MANKIQIKSTVTSTAPNSHTGGGGNVITVGEIWDNADTAASQIRDVEKQ